MQTSTISFKYSKEYPHAPIFQFSASTFLTPIVTTLNRYFCVRSIVCMPFSIVIVNQIYLILAVKELYERPKFWSLYIVILLIQNLIKKSIYCILSHWIKVISWNKGRYFHIVNIFTVWKEQAIGLWRHFMYCMQHQGFERNTKTTENVINRKFNFEIDFTCGTGFCKMFNRASHSWKYKITCPQIPYSTSKQNILHKSKYHSMKQQRLTVPVYCQSCNLNKSWPTWVVA